ncbi:LacI family DNA-binding transcriptional regulator [Streptomyces sp. NPDC048680]|uniref:LacI family DNA-binding transcriptional regulator n=1 Tax=Streptomyces sp. NPDC048680 TaxID=3155492 RepID=UPI00343055E3
MADVAARAGVSSQTVSRVANNRENVDAATREKVLSAMRDLGYRPNTAARALVTGRFGALGVVSFDVGAHGNARTLAAIADAAREADYSVNFMGVRTQTEAAVRQAFQHLMLQSVDGIVLIESQILDTPSLQLPPTMPVVVADGDTGHRYPNVDFDQAHGTHSVVAHLLGLGHRTVWHVAGPRDSFAARRRAETWQRTLTESGAPVPDVVHGDWTAESGYRAGRELAGRPEVTAVFAANDQMALGLMRALHEAGRDVPGDISVAGFDDISEAAFLHPPLTTVHQDFDIVGRHCVTLLLDQINGRTDGPHRMAVEPALVVRASTAPPAAGPGP